MLIKKWIDVQYCVGKKLDLKSVWHVQFQPKVWINQNFSMSRCNLKISNIKDILTISLTEKNYLADDSYYSDWEVTIYGQ